MKTNTYEVERKKGKKRPPYIYESDLVICLDSEATSGFMDKQTKTIEGYTKGKSEAYWNSKIPVCVPYIWTITIEDETFYIRELEELKDILEIFPRDTHYTIFIHNLGYDFSFLQNEFDFEDVFGREERHPIKATFADYKNIELRCSYTLTQLKLEYWGEKIGLNKAVGELDYNLLRTPFTKLSAEELHYCERDTEVMAKGLKEYRSKYKHIKDIPLTQTGEVRRPVKEMILADEKLHKKIVKLVPKNIHMYDLMKKAFSGGYTHANFLYTGEIVEDGSHYDFASSYPTVMCSEKFPMTPFTKDLFDPSKVNEKAYLMKVRFENIRAKKYNHYISVSKCTKKSENEHFEVDNGRLISASYIEIVITEQDYLTIKESYKFKRMEVLECYSSNKEYLPKCLVEFILTLYSNKTMYKGVKGMEAIYNQSKQFINSVFGMMVTDFMYDEVCYSYGYWDTYEKTPREVDRYLEDLKGTKDKQVFLAYQWGVWVCAYGRRNLWKCILSNDNRVVYCDTDSIFMIGDSDFSWYNKDITNKLDVMCKFYKIDFELTKPKDPKGFEHPLGIFDREDDWSEFCTLGAKRYCYRSKEDNELYLTVAGINKGAVKVLKNDIANFNENLVFDKDAEGVEKKLHTYVDNMETVVWGDGYVSTYKFGIVMRPTSYSMSLADAYLLLLSNTEGLRKNYLKCVG